MGHPNFPTQAKIGLERAARLIDILWDDDAKSPRKSRPKSRNQSRTGVNDAKFAASDSDLKCENLG